MGAAASGVGCTGPGAPFLGAAPASGRHEAVETTAPRSSPLAGARGSVTKFGQARFDNKESGHEYFTG